MTTDETTGNDNSPPPSTDWLTRQTERLDAWEQAVGLPKYAGVPAYQTEAVRDLEMTPNERSKLSPDEAAEACVVLSQYAAHLTRVAQRAETEAFLLQERVTALVAPHLERQQAWGNEMKRVLAVLENPEVTALDTRRVAAEAKAKRLMFFAARVDAVARAYQNLANARRRNREYGD
jgi:hypothetical protein